ncbi:MAG: hypothetical protein IIB00_06945 [candidate division Zixibacteria bacterium]|nr:hypothetical protein [candidate division Zixibacteria bacterium]
MRHLRLLIVSGLAISFLASTSYAAGNVTGTISAKKKKYLPNTIVYLDEVKGEFTPPKEPVVMDQKQMQFHPHVLPVLFGTTVDFLNSDEVAHNVFSPDETAGKVNLGTWAQGETRSYKFDKPCEKTCEAVMLCNVHPEMEAYVVVMQNPYYTMADDSGYFVIADVPAGEYTLKIWNPKKSADDQTITIVDGKDTEVTFKLKRKK